MHRQWLLIASTTFVSAVAVVPRDNAHTTQPARVPCLASTVNGDVQGVDNAGVSCSFLGVPYADAPSGANRWKPPRPATPWAPAVRSVKTLSTNCPSIQGTSTVIGNEDCLQLNIWVRSPAPSKPAPVLVWFHTGAFVASSANNAASNGRRLAEETGVIVVAPNYRLGPFGFLAHRALETEDPAHPSTGNYGLLDQRAALEWVRANIASFGGDPNNVTIAGTSAGAHSVGLHLVSPGSGGLFHRAIIQSAYPTSRAAERDEALSQGDVFAAQIGCTNPALVLSCMRSKSRDHVIGALPLYSQQVLEPINRFFWWPTVDGLVIPDQPRTLFEQGDFHHVPTLLGTNADEGWGNFVRRSFPAGPSAEQYGSWLGTEFSDAGQQIIDAYPLASFATPEHAMAKVLGDGQFVCETRRLADLIADGGLRGRGPVEGKGTGARVKMPVFLYSYEYALAEPTLPQVIHGAESNILFGNDYTAGQFPLNHALTAADLSVHATVTGYWSRFIATGDPNADFVSQWPVYQKNHESHMVIDGSSASAVEHKDESCAFWSGFNFRYLLGDVPGYYP